MTKVNVHSGQMFKLVSTVFIAESLWQSADEGWTLTDTHKLCVAPSLDTRLHEDESHPLSAPFAKPLVAGTIFALVPFVAVRTGTAPTISSDIELAEERAQKRGRF